MPAGTVTSSHRAVATGSALVVVGAMPGVLTASLYPRIEMDFAFSESALGVAVAVFYCGGAIGSAVAGRFVERVGARRGMRLCGVCIALAAGALATAGSAPALIAPLAVGAVANGLIVPTVSALLQELTPPERRGLAFGLIQTGGPLSGVLAGAALPLIAVPFGWQWAFLAAALSAGLVALASPPVGAAPPPAPVPAAAGSYSARQLRELALTAALAAAAGVGFMSFLVAYATDRGMSDQAAGAAMVAFAVAAGFGRLALGIAADRALLRPVAGMALTLALSAVGYALLLGGSSGLIVTAAIIVGAIGWSWPGLMILAVVRGAADPASGVGAAMVGTFAGAVAGPLVIGLLAHQGSWDGVWQLCIVLTLLAAAVAAIVQRGERPRT